MFIFADPLISLLTYEDGMQQLRLKFMWALRISAFLVPFSSMMRLDSAMMQSIKKSSRSIALYLLWVLKLCVYATVFTVLF